MVEAAGIEPASENSLPLVLHAYPIIILVKRYSIGGEDA